MTAQRIHPVLAQALAAIQALRDYQPTSPQDAAHLILGLTGDGTGEPNLLSELVDVVTHHTRTGPVLDLHPALARYVGEGVGYWQTVVEQEAGDLIGAVLEVLEHPGMTPLVGFYEHHGLAVADDDPEPTPAIPVQAAHLEPAGATA